MFEGLLYGQQGRGVFVADTRPIIRVLTGNFKSSIGDEIRRAGLTPSISEVAFSPVLPDADLKERLRLRGNAPVYRHKKVIFADQVPVAIDVVHLPVKLAEEMRERLRNEFVFTLVRVLGIEIGNIIFKFSSALASTRDSSLLNVAPRFPLIVARYVVFDDRAAPVLDGYTVARADRMSFELATKPEHTVRSVAVARAGKRGG